MAKNHKSKRQLVRDERRKKKGDGNDGGGGSSSSQTMRQRRSQGQASASGANSTPLAVKDNSLLFFDDPDGGEGAAVANAVADAVNGAVDEAVVDGKEVNAPAEESAEAAWEAHVDGRDVAYNGDNGGATGEAEYAGEAPGREFFGLLADAEQEYFRRADELLELNDFGSDGERRLFLANVFREARGKELKMASSQSCSRLMERLVQVASVRQKQRLFAAFRGHVLTLVTHRFASHCCEQLFLQAAPWVGREAEAADAEAATIVAEGGDPESMADEAETENSSSNDPLPSLEDSFLFVLDELEAHLSALLADRFASHTLRVLLVVLSGRPLDETATQALLHSKKKETVLVGRAASSVLAAVPARVDAAAAAAATPSARHFSRPVPASFGHAVRKIIADVAASLDSPATVRVLATHPTGNPVLQLLLELEMAEKKGQSKKGTKGGDLENDGGDSAPLSLLDRLLPGAPASLTASATTPAADLARTLVYDRIGSRLLETLITHGPGKHFKALYASMFAATAEGDRPLATYLRNDVACYPSMRVLERLGRDALANVVEQQVLQMEAKDEADKTDKPTGGRTSVPPPLVTQLVERGRFSVLRTLFERCAARDVEPRLVAGLVDALQAAVGGGRADPGRLVTQLCLPTAEAADGGTCAGDANNTTTTPAALPPAATAHACQLLAAMLAIPRAPSSAVQAALAAVDGGQLAALATQSAAGARVLVAALQSPQQRRGGSSAARVPLNKQLVARLVPHCMALALSVPGHIVLEAIVGTPSRTETEDAEQSVAPAGPASLPFHLKDALIAQLAGHEDELRQSRPGRSVWRAWKGDLWRHRRSEWVHFAKAGEPEGLQVATAPTLRNKGGRGQRDRPLFESRGQKRRLDGIEREEEDEQAGAKRPKMNKTLQPGKSQKQTLAPEQRMVKEAEAEAEAATAAAPAAPAAPAAAPERMEVDAEDSSAAPATNGSADAPAMVDTTGMSKKEAKRARWAAQAAAAVLRRAGREKREVKYKRGKEERTAKRTAKAKGRGAVLNGANGTPMGQRRGVVA